ncbi:DNA helicase-2 / ATP-dependent DNA helicase PcrA [Hespellia stercorisuis DSM 15480]|uniref:DNA 3'-5' helicase n=2 Tax=Hespellia stercorisuis TaxID=180311 RepID=A0A1M6UCM7_9FIRM|nr:DNA helicase-2 / ATP-dependent DNA helicase PcrA [Hespellia stercorisuis DSM 15480]
MNFERELAELNEYQRAAVLDENAACIVSAKVGSGKTTVLISKVLYLHDQKKVPYEDMVVLTFTNKAAGEIRERLAAKESSLSPEQLQGFGTFHSVALHLLRDVLPVEELGYEPGFTVIEPDEEVELALQIIEEEKLQIKYKNRLKKRLEQERTLYEQGKKETRYGDDLFVLMHRLGQEKLRQNKFTFRDLLRVSNFLLRRLVAEGEKEKFHPAWIIVDEVQDSDDIQIEFMEHLVVLGAKLFAVGDPNQVIYTWRGSRSNIFYQLKERFGARELTLPINYRSSGAILAAAKCFQQNPGELTGARTRGEKLRIRRHYNAFGEAQYLAAEIRGLMESGVACREIAVFYRLQSQSEILEKVFTGESIPFEVSVKKTIQDIPVLNWFLKVLRFSCNEKDAPAGVKALADKQYGEIRSAKRAREIIESVVTEKAERGRQKSGSESSQPADEHEGLTEKMCGFAEYFAEDCLENVIVDPAYVYDYFELDRYLKPTAARYSEDREYVWNLLERMITFALEQGLGFLEGFRLFLNSSALYGVQILQKEVNLQADSVKLMTLHASKGLEFSHVYIIGVNFGLIPLRTGDFETEDEERRLFFVGMTRAKDYLELSYYTNPDQVRVAPGESRYLQMIPRELVEGGVEEVRFEKTDLQKLRKEVEKSARVQPLAMLFGGGGAGKSAEESAGEPADKPVGETAEGSAEMKHGKMPRVRHAKYGVGTITSEDETMVTAEFENYGEKQFIKAFSELEYL